MQYHSRGIICLCECVSFWYFVCRCVCTWLLKCKNAFPSSSPFPRVKVSFVARKISLKKMKRQIFNCAYKDNTNSLSRTLKSFLASFIMIFLFFCIRHCRHISTCRLHLIFLLQFYHNIVLFYYYAGYVLQHFIIIIVVIVLPLIIQIFEASHKEKVGLVSVCPSVH